MLIIKERERRTPNPTPVTPEGESQPGAQESESSVVELLTAPELLLLRLLVLLTPRELCYERLTGQRSIRILTLEPSILFDEPLDCLLFEVQLDNAPPYTALSYAWDVSEGITTITCNGSFLQVTKNCARALQRIREMQAAEGRNSILNLWVDAICIDQGDTPEILSERLQQIQIMGEIYKRASHVTAWVGEHKNDSDYICEFFRTVGDTLDGEPNDVLLWEKAEALTLEKARQWIKFGDRFREFFQRSWFRRMWPIQEVTLPLPGRVTLVCGDSQIPFEYIRAGWQVLGKIGLLPGSVHLDQSVALQFYLADALALKRKDSSTAFIRRLGQPLITHLSELSLSSIMRATRFKDCSLAKDKFFALLGVFEELGIPHKVDVSKYTRMTEAEVFLGVFKSCVAYEKSLDVLRLAQSSEGYVGHDDFWAKRQDPYDSSSNAVFGTFAKVSPLLFRGVVDNAPTWRVNMPTWVPDWTQWTHSNIDDRDVALLRSYSTRALWGRPSWSANSSANLDSKICNTLQGTYLPESSFLRQLPRAEKGGDPRILRSVHGHLKLRVRAKVVGVVKSVGSVDSVALLWQLLSSTFNFYGWQRGVAAAQAESTHVLHKEPFFQRVPDAFLAAMIETIRNFVVNSNFAQITLSLRMIYQAYGVTAFFRYFNAVYQAWFLRPVLKRAFCSISPSTASCLASGLEIGQPSWITIGVFTILQIFFIHLWLSNPVDNQLRRFSLFYNHFRRLGSAFIVCCAYLAWEFRVSIYNTMYSQPYAGGYEEMPTWFIEPFLVNLAILSVLPLLAYFQDEVLILLARAIFSMSSFPTVLFVLLYTRVRFLTRIMLVYVGFQACRCMRGTVGEILGSEMFVRRGSFTTGLSFVTTDSGLTGSTSGPIQLFDVIVIVDRTSDPIVLRRCGEAFEVVGVAYIGNMSRKGLEESFGAWNTIDIQ